MFDEIKNNITDYIDKFLLTRRLERKQKEFQRELKDAFREKKKTIPLTSLLLLFVPIVCGGIFFWYYSNINDVSVVVSTEQKKQIATIPVEVIPKKPQEMTGIKVGKQRDKVSSRIKEKVEKVERPIPPVELKKTPLIPDVPEVEVITDKAAIYAGENNLGDVIAFLEKGSVLELIDEVKKWKKVRYGDRKIGWLKARDTISVTGQELKTTFSATIEITEKPSILLAKDFLKEWVSRTESRDIESYIKLYDDEFTGKGNDRTAWKIRKGGIFKNARFILVGIKKIRILEETDTTLKVTFVQYYNNSDSLKTTNKKVLILRKVETGYRILREYLQ